MEQSGRGQVSSNDDYAALLRTNSGMPGGIDASSRPAGKTGAVPAPDDEHRTASALQERIRSIRELLPVVTPVIALLATVLSGAALWLSHKPPPGLNALQARVTSLHADVSQGLDLKREVAALTAALEATQSHLAALDEAVARQMVSPPKSRATQDLAARLDTLTAAVEELHARATDAGTTTEPSGAQAANKPGAGSWAVHLSAFSKEKLAHAEVARLQALDIPAERHAFVDQQGRTWHRVFVRGFETRAAAENARSSFQTTAGVPRTWLERLPSAAGEQAQAGG